MSLDAVIPAFWTAELILPRQKTLIFSQPRIAISKYVPEGILSKGNTVHIPVLSDDGNIVDYDETVGLSTPDRVSATAIDLVIEAQKAFNFRVGKIEAVQAAPEMVKPAIARRAYQIKDLQDQYSAAKIIAGGTPYNLIGGSNVAITLPAPITSADTITGDAARNLVVDVETRMSVLLNPTDGLCLVVHPVFAGLLKKSKVLTNLAGAPGVEVVINGYVGRLSNFDVLESVNCPEDTLVGMSPDSYAFVEQINSIEGYVHPSFFGEAVRGLVVYGGKVMRASGLLIVKFAIA
jgi:hypothetical protein